MTGKLETFDVLYVTLKLNEHGRGRDECNGLWRNMRKCPEKERWVQWSFNEKLATNENKKKILYK